LFQRTTEPNNQQSNY